ncbi:hypothetical protein [Oribacterium sp. NK2B42]|uniref:hypothetical protein n=1 Tax=Oribacterium sp. NK2B42 TaxID=689781 RepID=UPI00041123DC|nr:hypothetical protein [Oribacterium sp. NK2B42]
MKRIITQVLCLTLIALLISCGKSNTKPAETNTTENHSESSSEEVIDISKTVLLKIETEGLGYVAYAEDGEQRTDETFNAWDYVDE